LYARNNKRHSFQEGSEQKQRTIEQRLRYNLGRWNLKLKGELDPQV
jgi:hypothetical protein